MKTKPIEVRVGYHVEGGETFELSKTGELSMGTLDNARPLYMCDNPVEWYPAHLKYHRDYRVYAISYNVPTLSLNFKNWEEYNSLVEWDGKKYIRSKDLKKYISAGYHLFTLDKDNDKGELTEFILINPKEYVVSIKPMDVLQLSVENINVNNV
jgi:hypothetical protein